MEKIININYQGSVIPIEESAYQNFIQYEAALQQYLSKESDAEEIFKDLQLRMHELLSSKLTNHHQFITHADVQDVIATIGHPATLSELERTEGAASSGNILQPAAPSPFRRNSNDKIIDGLCSGMANYVGMDPVAIRLLMVLFTLINPLLGLLIYGLGFAFIPSAPLLPNSTRQFFRNPHNKVLGGICGGLAAFFNKEVWIFRIIFLLPVLLGLFGGGDFLNHFNWIGGSLSGSVILLYIIIWIITPAARTPQQLRLLHGQGINLSNYTEVQNLPLAMQSNSNSGLNTLVRVLAFIVIGIALIIFIPIAFGMVLGGVMVHELAALVLATPFMKAMFWCSLLLFFALPVIALIVWLLRRLLGARHNKRYVMVFGSLFALGLVATILLASSLLKEMNTMNKVVSTLPLHVQGDTLYVKGMNADTASATVFSFNSFNDLVQDQGNQIDIRAVRWKQHPTTDSQFSVTVRRYSLGSNRKDATENASLVNYVPYFDSKQSLYLPLIMHFPKGEAYRGQNIEVVIHVPEGKTLITDPALDQMNRFTFEVDERRVKVYTHRDDTVLITQDSSTGIRIRHHDEELEEERYRERMERLEERRREKEEELRETEEELRKLENERN